MTGAWLPRIASRRCWPALVLVVLGLGTAFQTLPAFGHWGDQFATNVGDPVYIMWVNVTQTHHLLSPLQGNIFYPHDNVIAYSDTLIPYLTVFLPVFKLTGDNPIAAYNAVLFFGYLAGALAVYALAFQLVRSQPGALVGALLFTIAPYRSAAIGHAQLVGVCFLILGFLFLIRFLEGRRIIDAALLGVMAGLAWLGTLYCFMMLIVSILAFAAVWLVQHRHELNRDLLRGAVVAIGASLVFIAPTLPAYVPIARSGLITRDVNSLLTVKSEDFTYLPPSRLYTALGRGTLVPDIQSLYPGTLLLLGAGAGTASLLLAVLAARRRKSTSSAAQTKAESLQETDRRLFVYIVPLVAAAVVCCFVMLGAQHSIVLSGPYRVMRKLIPGMQNLRDLTRFWLVPLIVLAVLAAEGVAFVSRRLHRTTASCLAVLLCAAAGFELIYSQPMATVAYAGPATDVNHVLAGLPAGPVVEFPLPPDGTFDYAFTVAPRQLRSTLDGRDRLEGYSGESPNDVVPRLNAVRLLPDPAALTALRANGLRYIVVHGGPVRCSGELTTDEVNTLVNRLQSMSDQVERVVVAGDDRVVVLRASSSAADGAAALRSLPQAPVVSEPLCFPGAVAG